MDEMLCVQLVEDVVVVGVVFLCLLDELCQFGCVLKYFFGVQWCLFCVELLLVCGVVILLFVVVLVVIVVGVGFGFIVLVLIGVVLVKWFGFWLWLLVVLVLLQGVLLVVVIGLFCCGLYWFSLLVMCGEFGVMMCDVVDSVCCIDDLVFVEVVDLNWNVLL